MDETVTERSDSPDWDSKEKDGGSGRESILGHGQGTRPSRGLR